LTLSEPPVGGDISEGTSNVARAAVAAAVLPHLDAAFNLARWLTRDEHDAADVVQEAYLRAAGAADTFRGGGGAKAWLLAIVRNAAFDSLRRDKRRQHEELVDDAPMTSADAEACDPQAILLRAANAERVRSAIEQLPAGIREVIVLREMEEMSYKEIAAVVGAPIGTVMSRLARGRRRLQELLSEPGESSERRNKV
jgi:RNA polymerase sigma-70 factor (ECF subfamily)